MEQESTKIKFIDTHAHLDFENFDQDRDAVIKNAQLANVSAIINIEYEQIASHIYHQSLIS